MFNDNKKMTTQPRELYSQRTYVQPEGPVGQDYDLFISIVRQQLEDKAITDNELQTLKQLMRLKSFQRLQNKDTINELYEEYTNNWIIHHSANKPWTKYDMLIPSNPNSELINKSPKRETFNKQLDKYINEHINEPLMTFEQFEQVTLGWNRGRKSLEQWYEEYKNKYFKQPRATVKYTFNDTGLIGYKGKDKIKTLIPMFPNKSANENQIKSSFNLKSNIKHYQLHKCSARNTWIIDFMFCDKLAYLVAINANTKYLYVELVNRRVSDEEYAKGDLKSAISFVKALLTMIEKGMNVRHLTGDGEKAFVSFEAQRFYESRGIDFKPVPRQVMGAYPDFMKKEQKAVKTDPLHGSLGIIDRVIRTIRDMAYNMQIGVITPRDMDDIVNQYNNAPHKGLSKWAGFLVTPQMVNDDPELEDYIVRKICQENYNIMNSPGFKLNEGAHVKVYNERDAMNKRRSIIQPGDFVINGFRNGLYEVNGIVNG